MRNLIKSSVAAFIVLASTSSYAYEKGGECPRTIECDSKAECKIPDNMYMSFGKPEPYQTYTFYQAYMGTTGACFYKYKPSAEGNMLELYPKNHVDYRPDTHKPGNKWMYISGTGQWCISDDSFDCPFIIYWS